MIRTSQDRKKINWDISSIGEGAILRAPVTVSCSCGFVYLRNVDKVNSWKIINGVGTVDGVYHHCPNPKKPILTFAFQGEGRGALHIVKFPVEKENK